MRNPLHDPTAMPPASVMELLRQTLEGLWPATPDLTALFDRMESAR